MDKQEQEPREVSLVSEPDGSLHQSELSLLDQLLIISVGLEDIPWHSTLTLWNCVVVGKQQFPMTRQEKETGDICL